MSDFDRHYWGLEALDPSDASAGRARIESIARFLDPSQSIAVRESACRAADHCVRGADESSARRIGDRLGALVVDHRVDDEIRIRAISALRNNPALDQESALVAVMTEAPLRLATYAAWSLARRNPDHPELRRVVASWPDDAKYPADEVRDLLKQRPQ